MNRLVRFAVFGALFASALALIAFGQTPKPVTPPAGPKITHEQQLEIENIELRVALLNDEERTLPQRRADLQQQFAAIVSQINREHPGFVYNPQDNSFVPAAKATSPAAKGAKK